QNSRSVSQQRRRRRPRQQRRRGERHGVEETQRRRNMSTIPGQLGSRSSARLTLSVLGLVWSLTPFDVVAAKPVDFSREVKPILARRCFACHGPESGEGGLRLDSRETALAELESGLLA